MSGTVLALLALLLVFLAGMGGWLLFAHLGQRCNDVAYDTAARRSIRFAIAALVGVIVVCAAKVFA